MQSKPQQGFISEQVFVLEALKQGFKVSQPLFAQEVYDFILDFNGKLNRIQVKATNRFDEKWKRYSVTGSKRNGELYTKNDTDFIVAVISDIKYYIIPISEVSSKGIRIYDKETRKLSNTSTGKYDKYLNRWDLLK